MRLRFFIIIGMMLWTGIGIFAQDIPDGELAVICGRDDAADIYLMNTDGEVIEQLTDNLSYDVGTAWSHDGQRLAYVSRSNSSDDTEIMILDMTTGDTIQLTDNDYNDMFPDWSPDDTRLVFDRSDDDGQNIYFIDIETGEETPLRITNTNEQMPRFSPDGSLVSFIRWQGTDNTGDIRNIVVADLENDGAERQPTEVDGMILRAEWSPDGVWLYFSSTHAAGSWEIFRLELGGERFEQLTENMRLDYGPHLSPDGTTLAYHAEIEGAGLQVVLHDIETGDVTQLTNNENECYFPTWRPTAP